MDRFSGPSLGRALGRGGPRPSLLLPFNHPHDPLLRQVAAWIAYPPPPSRLEGTVDHRSLRRPWAELLQRTFAVDVLWISHPSCHLAERIRMMSAWLGTRIVGHRRRLLRAAEDDRAAVGEAGDLAVRRCRGQ